MVYESINKINSLYEKSKRYHLLSHILFGIGAAVLLFVVFAVPSMFLFGIGGAILCCLVSIIFFAPEAKRAMKASRREYKDTFVPGMLNESFDNAKFEYWVGLTEMEVMQTSLYKLGK